MRKTRIFLITAILLLITILTVDIALAGGPAALVSDLKGKVTVSRVGSKKPVPLEILSELMPGDKIIVEKNAQIKVTFYTDTHSEVIKGYFEGTVLQDKIKMQKGNKTSAKKIAAYQGVKTLRSIEASSEKFGGASARNRKEFGVAFFNPRRTIATIKPAFEFDIKTVKPSDTLKVFLINDRNKDIIFEKPCEGSRLPFPADVKPLERGKTYKWNLIVYRNGEKLKEAVKEPSMQPFNILNEKKYSDLQNLKRQVAVQTGQNPADLSPYAVLLTYCLENNLLEESFETCQVLLKHRPKNKNLKKLLYRLCELREMNKEESDELFKKLVKGK